MQALLLEEKPLPVEPWFSSSLRSRLHGRTVEVDIPRRLRRALHVPEMVNVSLHAEKHRVVTGVDSSPGPWRPDLVPHASKVMDTYGLPWVEEVWFCAVERAAKTNIMLNCMQWAIDCDPGNIFALSPTELDSGKLVSKKIIPMLQASLRLSRYLSPRMDDLAKTLISFNHGMSIFPAHANSASTMAAFYGKHCFAEEVDKYPHRTGREASPIALIRKRGRDKRGSKRMFSSTPAQQFIWEGVLECHQIWEYELCCPSCGAHFIPKQDHIVIDGGATVERVERGDSSVHLSAPCCGTVLSEAERDAAYRWGRWTATKGADLLRPAKVGFHLPAWGLPSVPLVEIAAAILRAASGDVGAKIALANGYAAENHREEHIDRKEDQILRLRDDRPEGLVPSVPIAAITAVADMQKRGFWFKITAWGFGLEQESWLLRSGFVDSWEALKQLFFATEFKDVKGNRYVVTLRGIDSGGGESEDYVDLSRTGEAYLFACANPGIILFKGQRTMASPYSFKIVDRFPGTNKPLPGSPYLYTLNSKHYKDQLAAKLMVDPNSPGAWHLHSGYTAEQGELLRRDPSLQLSHNLEEMARQMCVEGKDEKGGFWVNPKKRANHLWDDSYMELALVDIAQVKFMRPPTGPVSSGRRVLSNGV